RAECNVSRVVIVNLQLADLPSDHVSNLSDGSIHADETINSKQHGNSFGSSFLTARNQGLESVGNANSIHIGSNNTQITSASVGGDPLCNAIVHDSSPNVTVVLEVGDHTHTRNSSASSAESIGEVSDGGGANVLRGGIQSRLKVSVILHVDLQA